MSHYTTITTMHGEYEISNLNTEVALAKSGQLLGIGSLMVHLDPDPAYTLKPSYFVPADRRVKSELDQKIVYALGLSGSSAERVPWLDWDALTEEPTAQLLCAFVSHHGLRLRFVDHIQRKFYDYNLSVARNIDVKISFHDAFGRWYLYEELHVERHPSLLGLGALLNPLPSRVYRVSELEHHIPDGPRKELYFMPPSSGALSGESCLIIRHCHC